MKFEIKNRFTGSVIFELECGSLRLCVEAAIKGGANLRGADLYDANLRGADLYDANLYGANLGGADLGGADLGGANLGGANLYGANLGGANLYGANLGGADLRGANLGGANLGGANLGGADLYDADLYDADLRGANLGGKKLIGARPFMQVGPIGSRSDYLLSFITDGGVMLRAGCFFGTRDEFSAKLDAEHGSSEHGKEYRAALALIDAHAEIWTPAAEAKEAA